MEDYFIAEDLVLRKIEASFNEPIRRQAAIYTATGHIQFDGIVTQNNLVTCIEVFFSKEHHIPMDRVDRHIYRALEVKNHLSSIGKRFHFMLAIVIDEPGSPLKEELIDNITNKFTLAGVRMQLRVFNFGLLKKEFSIT